MVSSALEQYRISDLIDWHERGQLVLSPAFQRGLVWTQQAKAYLIDTILRQLPVPKIFMRTSVNLETRQSIREIVDGQQRLRAIIEFANDQLRLGKRSNDLAGVHYSILDDNAKQAFLSYAIAVEQLINASDSDVLEIFSRLNSYTVPLNAAELRHAQFSGNLKWSIHERAMKWKVLWEDFGVLTVRERVRMLDDSLMAEMYSIVMQGVTDGGQQKITRFYERFDSPDAQNQFNLGQIEELIDNALDFITVEFREILMPPSRLSGAPHFLMLFAAAAHALNGIPQGGIKNDFPDRHPEYRLNTEPIRRSLAVLNEVLEADEPIPEYVEFWNASKVTTQRIASRSVRFLFYWRAFEGGYERVA